MTEYSLHLTTILSHITTVPNSRNSHVISEFFHYVKRVLEPLKTMKIKILDPAYFTVISSIE